MKTFIIAKVLVVNDAGELLVLRRSQTDDRRPGQWDFPGGFVERGEDVLAAAKRETFEETGVTVADCTLAYAFSEVSDPRGSGTWLAFITRVQGRPKVTLSYEHDAFDWLPFEKAASEFEYERQRRMLEYVRDNHLLDE